ncbi:unnamed protein product [Cylicocyclus nassatus]|uniref:Uncharacterized protein n=1 Tax=Cylicocyclus nassatus TaxID=53992 RepID=A0AA36H6U0_CYLNA|nr:unnamed protein product [Cylicocyclus nassatus]
MSLLGSHKAQLTKAANILRKKIAEVEQANLESESLTFDAGKDYDFVISRRTFLSEFISSISCTASYLRAQREKAEEFARSRPDEQGEFPFLVEIYAHWEANDMADLLVEADILLERLDNKIKLLPNADMLYERHLSSIASTQLTLNPASSPSSSDTAQPQVSAQPAQVPPSQDRPSDPSSVAPVDHDPLASDAGTPQQGNQRPRAPSGFGNPFLTLPPAQTSMHPFGSSTLLPNPTSNPPLASTSGPSSSTSYSLPSFEIPYFSGDMDAFHEFWNIFAASVHNNNSVPVPVKFMYLKTHLRGDAANIIANFQPTEENYEDAVRTIISTYDRPEHLRLRLWDKLNKQAPAKDSAASQRATLGSIRAIWSQMKRLKEESSIGALNMIRSKFPRRTREKVGEMKKKEDQMWTVDDLLKAFDTVIDRLQIVEDADPTPYVIYNSDSTVRQTSSPPRRYSRERPQQTRPSQCQPSTCPTCSRPLCSPSEYRTARSRSPTPYYPRRSSRSPARPQRRAYQDYCCAFCQVEGHRAEDCFEVPYPTQRRTIVKQEAPPCAFCGRSHHPALCFNRPRASNTFTPTTSFHRRSISPKRVQFDIEAQTSTDRALQRSRSSSPRASVRLPLRNNKRITTLTFGGHQFTEDSSEVTLTLWDKYDRPVDLQLWTRDVITTVPRIDNIDDVTQGYSDERVEVDVLIGIDNYWRVVDLNRNERLPSGLILSHTLFGPVLSGSVHPAVNNTISAMTALNDDAPGTEQLVRSLLGLVTIGLEEDETSTDASTIRHFYDTVRVIDVLHQLGRTSSQLDPSVCRLPQQHPGDGPR